MRTRRSGAGCADCAPSATSLIGSIESLRREPALRVLAVRLLLDREEDGSGGGNSDADSGAGGAAEGALSTDIVREVVASRWDSVEDAKRLAHAAYGLPAPEERRAGRGRRAASSCRAAASAAATSSSTTTG